MSFGRINFKRIFYFVVAMPTIKYLIATGRYDLASPLIMRTAIIPRTHLQGTVITRSRLRNHLMMIETALHLSSGN